MANPRKFSEKIALHTHRQAEETARFEQIMKEVSDATARPEDNPSNSNRHFRESRPRSQGGPIRRPQDRKHDTSPYSPGPFLSPPSDTNWRRTNSDSALHQSAMQGTRMNERNDTFSRRWMLQTKGDLQNPNTRPKSSCEIPLVPGIVNVYPATSSAGAQIPIGNNTGSLPDLTTLHFSTCVHSPTDRDQEQGSSSYSSSPVNTSSPKLSPINVPTEILRSLDHYQYSNHQHPGGMIFENNLVEFPDRPDFTDIDNVENIFQQCKSNHQHHQKQHQRHQQPQQPHQQHQHQHQQQNQLPSNSSLQHSIAYRNPRPSPQSSPGLGNFSEPCSPSDISSPPTPETPNDYHLLNHHKLQQHFEQFSMMDAPISPITSMSYLDNPSNAKLTQTQAQTIPDPCATVNSELSTDTGYYSTSPSQLVYPTTAPTSLHTTPNTPTSIPDIILTDFSSEDLIRQNLSLSKQLEADILSDESLREGLGPIDLDGLQMLSDPAINLIPDSVEDHFRLDRL